MKIALFYNLAFGGAKRVTFEHVKGLKELGNLVDVYTTDEQEDIFSSSKIADNYYVYPFKIANLKLPIVKKVYQDFSIFYLLKRLHQKIATDIDTRNYDIVLVHTDTNTQAPFILRFLKTNNAYFCLEPLRIVYEYSLRSSKDMFFLNRLYESVTRSYRKKIDLKNARSAKHTIALSLFGREYMIHAYDLYPKISYLGVDTNIFKQIIKRRKNQVLFVAEKESIYGYDFAREAIELIPKPVRPKLKIISWTKDNNLRISDKELVANYSESFVALSLSKFDTFGLVPLESMACQTPVIAFNVAGYRETIKNGETGYLVDFDKKEIADQII